GVHAAVVLDDAQVRVEDAHAAAEAQGRGAIAHGQVVATAAAQVLLGQALHDAARIHLLDEAEHPRRQRASVLGLPHAALGGAARRANEDAPPAVAVGVEAGHGGRGFGAERDHAALDEPVAGGASAILIGDDLAAVVGGASADDEVLVAVVVEIGQRHAG